MFNDRLKLTIAAVLVLSLCAHASSAYGKRPRAPRACREAAATPLPKFGSVDSHVFERALKRLYDASKHGSEVIRELKRSGAWYSVSERGNTMEIIVSLEGINYWFAVIEFDKRSGKLLGYATGYTFF